jgi:hypothetical protein
MSAGSQRAARMRRRSAHRPQFLLRVERYVRNGARDYGVTEQRLGWEVMIEDGGGGHQYFFKRPVFFKKKCTLLRSLQGEL